MIRNNTEEMQAIDPVNYANWTEMDRITDFVTRLYLYALFNLSEQTTLIGAASYDLVNTSTDLFYAWGDPAAHQSQTEHTLDSSLTAGRLNVGVRLAVHDNAYLRVGGGIEVNQQRRSNNDLDLAGAPVYAAANTGSLVEFNSFGSGVDNGQIEGLGGSMTSSTATTFHLLASCLWYAAPDVALFGRANLSLGSTTTVYEAFDVFDDSVYREEQGGSISAWDGSAVFGVSLTPFEQVTLGIDTGTSFNGSGSGSSDSLPTGATIYALSDLLDSSNWSFSGSANMPVRLN